MLKELLPNSKILKIGKVPYFQTTCLWKNTRGCGTQQRIFMDKWINDCSKCPFLEGVEIEIAQRHASRNTWSRFELQLGTGRFSVLGRKGGESQKGPILGSAVWSFTVENGTVRYFNDENNI